MSDQTYVEISVQKILPNKLNPRSKDDFKGAAFDKLKASIKEKGVISPILVRPTAEDKFEIVYGERRFKAVLINAKENGNPAPVIPAMVKDLSDDELFDLMTIENIHRKDLTPLQEAQSYKKYLTKRGDKALDDLSIRIGLNPQRIRRRIRILTLPKEILKAWDDELLLFGHLEQFIRLDTEKLIMEFAQNVLDQSDEGVPYPVKHLKDEIDELATALEHAKFDLTACQTCNNNTEVQKTLFGTGMEKASCLDIVCFKEKQGAWFKENWNITDFRKKHGTNGFVFRDEVQYGDFYGLHSKAGMKKFCKGEKCEKFVSIIYPDGRIYDQTVCVGDDSKCAEKVNAYTGKKDKDGKVSILSDSKRDHGLEFREHFLQLELPKKLEQVSVNDVKIFQFQLYSFMKVHGYLDPWFAVRVGLAEMEKDEDTGLDKLPYFHWFDSKSNLWNEIKKLDAPTAKKLLKEATIETLMNPHKFGTDERFEIAKYLGTSLKKEWYITPEYLKKKRIKEILEMAETFKFFEKPTVKKYMNKKFGGDDPTRLKKKELIQVFLESGQNLVGMVPNEIIA